MALKISNKKQMRIQPKIETILVHYRLIILIWWMRLPNNRTVTWSLGNRTNKWAVNEVALLTGWLGGLYCIWISEKYFDEREIILHSNSSLPFSQLFVYSCGLQLKSSLRMIFRVLRLEAFFQPQAKKFGAWLFYK